MFSITRNTGLELPVYDASTPVVWGNAGLDGLEERKSDTIVRRVRFRAFGSPTLKSALAKADADFEMVADACGARVVNHTWGLYRVKNNKNRHFGLKHIPDSEITPVIPDRHILVAEVDIIAGARKLSPAQKRLVTQASMSLRDQTPVGQLYWSEACWPQFITAQPEDSQGQWPLWLVDIEPIMDTKVE